MTTQYEWEAVATNPWDAEASELFVVQIPGLTCSQLAKRLLYDDPLWRRGMRLRRAPRMSDAHRSWPGEWRTRHDARAVIPNNGVCG